MTRVPIRSEILRWARDRFRLSGPDLRKRFPKLREWETGRRQPTLKQLQGYAQATHTPFGFFFLASPPEESIPIPDCRTMAERRLSRPSPNLLDTIYLCQHRQAWYEEYVRSTAGYRIEIVLLSLPSAQLTLQRIAGRVRQGGHNIPRADMLRRLDRSWKDFHTLYRPLAHTWAVYDNSGEAPRLLEEGP